jgi:hydroxyacylglutathione hydrolase
VVGAAADSRRLPALDQAVREGDIVTLGNESAHVLETPGHTRGHISFAFDDVLLCGDTLFSLGCGRLLEGTAEEMYGSLQKFSGLPGSTRVCCGHEYTESNGRFALSVDPDNIDLQAMMAHVRALRAAGKPSVPSTLAQERACNPFVRAPDVATFALLRAKKDRF